MRAKVRPLKRIATSPTVWFLSVLAVVVGVGLVAVSAWARPLVEAQQAADAGRLQEAFQYYAATETRFDRLPFAKHLLPEAYRESVVSQVWIHYQLHEYDALLEKAAASPSVGPVHFWAGCALFAKAREEDNAEARLTWLGRAAEEFRSALEQQPDDWDTKYNFELTRRLLDELRKQPKTPTKQMLQLLRPEPNAVTRPGRRVG
jgi:hypothetical protein